MKNPLILTILLVLTLAGCADDRPDSVIEKSDLDPGRMETADRDMTANDMTANDMTASGTEVDSLNSMNDSALLGKEVVSTEVGAIGEVDSVVRDPIDQGRMVVIALSGPQGTGLKEVAVPIERLRISASDRQKLEIDLTRAQLEAMPDFDEGEVAGNEPS